MDSRDADRLQRGSRGEQLCPRCRPETQASRTLGTSEVVELAAQRIDAPFSLHGHRDSTSGGVASPHGVHERDRIVPEGRTCTSCLIRVARASCARIVGDQPL